MARYRGKSKVENDPLDEAFETGFYFKHSDVKFTLYRSRMSPFRWSPTDARSVLIGYNTQDEIDHILQRVKNHSRTHQDSMYFEIIDFSDNKKDEFKNNIREHSKAINFKYAHSVEKEVTRIQKYRQRIHESNYGYYDSTRRFYIPFFILADRKLTSSESKAIHVLITSPNKNVYPFFAIEDVTAMPDDLIKKFDMFAAIGDTNTYAMSSLYPQRYVESGTPKKDWIGVGYSKSKKHNVILHSTNTREINEYGMEVNNLKKKKLEAYKKYLTTLDDMIIEME